MLTARILLVALTVAAAAGCASATAGPTTMALYVSLSGDDAGRCTVAAPCKSFDRAYQVAPAGARVLVGTGDYGLQNIATTSAKESASPVVFAPAPGASVRISDELDVYGSHIRFERLNVDTWYVHTGADDVTFYRVTTRLLFIRSASNVRVLGGSVGGIADGSSPAIGAASVSTAPAKDILIDGVAFHDVTRDAAPDAHVQCLFIQAVDGLILRNSTFRRCGIMDVYVNNIFDGSVPRNVLIENNLFDRTVDGGFYALYLRNDPGDVIDGFVLRYNSFLQGPHFDGGSYVNSRVVANVSAMNQNQCTAGLVFAHNVFDRARCGPTDRRAADLGFVDSTAFRLGLRRRSAGIDAGDTEDYPLLDFAGHRRPRGGRPDAGAYENR